MLDYNVKLEVSDENDEIQVDERITAKLLTKVDSFCIDLQSLSEGKGMTVSQLQVHVPVEYLTPFSYHHSDNKVWILCSTIPVGMGFYIDIVYSGIPETGLIIGQNKFEKRTFFGDNWPNRAHHWFACIDHPSDKATVSFTVTHPKKYEVVATGTLVNMDSSGEKTITAYSSALILPTKVMVVGIAEFEKEAISHNYSELFPMHAWVYEDAAEYGFNDMAVAADVANYFVRVIGDYPFEKLDHVQSTTQFGGMENAGNIFYDENAVTGEGTMEALIAHEVAHQWFGNSASESDWKHLWLSEGFATYFTDLYWEAKYGTQAMNERLIEERERVIRFSKQYAHPVIDTTYQSLMDLLNANSYQKGAWFLHMLRNEVGDDAFWNGIRKYYETYQYANATSSDFQAVMESESKLDLDVFFHQWLKETMHPILKIKGKASKKKLIIKQMQTSHLFAFDLEVELIYTDGTTEIKVIPLSKEKELILFESEKKIKSFNYDPNVKLLFERMLKKSR